MKDVVKGIFVGVISTILVSGVGYIFIVKENQMKIDNIEKILSNYDGEMEASGKSINALKLFVVSAHPDKDYIPIASASKLQRMSAKEVSVLAAAMQVDADVPALVGDKMLKSNSARTIIKEYDLTKEDLEVYYKAINASYIDQ